MRLFYLVLICILLVINITAQQKSPEWDKTISGKWGVPLRKEQILSSADHSLQQTWLYTTTAVSPQPLIVSLHTWSGDYNQDDPLAHEALLRNWNYIHPDFRGANKRPEACGSALALADLKDAIRYMISTGNVDTSAIHIIGVSGGGYMTLMAWQLLDLPIRSFNAWVPISDLNSWYRETKTRGLRYADDLVAVSGTTGKPDSLLLAARSPLQLGCAGQKNKNAELHIYTGVNDGYTGSVPVTHSLLFFNQTAACLYPDHPEYQLPATIIHDLAERHTENLQPVNSTIADRKILFQRNLKAISVTVFDGGHEMLSQVALTLLPGQRDPGALKVVTIGDSNGAFDYGWPFQLQKLLPSAKLLNYSIAGNTIGFDNNGQEKLNTLRKIEEYLDAAAVQFQDGKSPAIIFIGLGTNDTKDVFRDRQLEVLRNLEMLIKKIRTYYTLHGQPVPAICLLAAPPVYEPLADTVKYKGCAERIIVNNRKFAESAAGLQIGFIDPYSTIRNDVMHYTTDGIHLNPYAQFICATALADYLNPKK